MATNLSQTGLEVSASAHADIPTGGTDKVLLYASGSGAATRLYVKSGNNTQKQLGFDIDQFDALGGTGVDQADHFIFSDGGTEKKITFSNMEDAIFGNVSGDATIAAGGALTIANDAVEQAMIADDAVGADQLASNAVVNASIASNAAIDMDKLDGGSLASSLSDLAQGDLLYAGDVDDSNNLKSITFSNLEDAIFGNVSGDATIAAGGALTIAAQAVENSMLADDAVGADELAANAVVNASVVDGALKADKLDLDGSTDIGADLADADLMIVDDGAGGTNRVAALSRVKKYIYSAMSGDATASDTGALTIAANAVEGSMLNSNAAGDGLGYESNALVVQVSGAVHITSDKVALSGSIAGTGLTYTGGVNSIATLALDIDELSAKGDASLHQTQDHFLVSDNGTEKKISFSNLEDAIFGNVSGDATVAAGGALTIAADAVESGMLNDNVISGQTELASDALNAADEMMISDGGTLKKIGVDNLFKDGPGLLSAADVDVSADHIVFLDGGATGDAKIESINDLATGMAGDGLSAGSGQLAVSVDDSSIETNSDALRVKAGGIQTSMLADDAVDADKLASNAVVNASVASNAAIAATKVNFSVDLGGSILFGTQADDTVAFTGPIKAGGNTIADSGNNAAIALDGSGGMSTLGGFGGGSGITFASSGGAQFATAVTVNKSDGSMSNDFKVFGDTAGAHFMYDASADKGLYHNGTAQVLELGTSANGFAIEVANLAGDAGKIKATAFVTYSDESLKEEVTAMDNALNAVMNLNGVEFTWKNSGQRDFGFLAQEVKNVIPQAVSVGNDGIHGVDYSRLTSVLVEAVKAQQVQIEELKALLKK